jgi:perosamine synthetase
MIPVAQPFISDDDIQEVVATMRAGWVSSRGPAVDAFENAFARYCGRAHGVAVSSGTAAMELAVAGLQLPPGAEVIVPNFTMISVAAAVIRNGLRPVPVDADPDTWCLDAQRVDPKISPRTRAIIAAHVYGHPAPMPELQRIAEYHGLEIVEDAAEAHGARCQVHGQWPPCGGFGRASGFSFYGNKLISTGEGGMLVTDDPAVAGRARSLRSMAFGTDQHFRHEELGYTYRLSSLQAALGLSQLRRLDDVVARRRQLADRYRAGLAGLPLRFQREAPWAQSCWWVFGVMLDETAGVDAAGLARRLESFGIETRPFFTGLHEQPALQTYQTGDPYPVSEALARRGLYLPSGVPLTDPQVDEVCARVRQCLGGGGT